MDGTRRPELTLALKVLLLRTNYLARGSSLDTPDLRFSFGENAQ